MLTEEHGYGRMLELTYATSNMPKGSEGTSCTTTGVDRHRNFKERGEILGMCASISRQGEAKAQLMVSDDESSIDVCTFQRCGGVCQS